MKKDPTGSFFMRYNRTMARRKKRALSPYFPTILIVIGIALVGIWGLHKYLYTRSLTLSDSLVSLYKAKHTNASYPIHIQLGSNINSQVVESTVVNGSLVIASNKANHLLASAVPGEPGNIIIYAHNYVWMFGYLVDSKIGDIARIYTDDGRHHDYVITEVHTVTPSDTSLLSPTNHEALTLYTCTGLLDSLRFVVRAKPVSL